MPRGDVLGNMPPAGKAGAAAAHSSSMSETLAGYKPPSTPEHLKPFRMSGKGAVGGQSSHYSKGEAFVVPDKRYGRANTYDESTASRFAEMREPVFQPKSRAYASELREPLGKSMTYGFQLPPDMQAPEFRFGKSSVGSEPVKTVMYPPEGPGSLPSTKEPMYQTQRNYDWARVQIDPTDFRFGAASNRTVEEVFNPTQLVPLPTVQQRQQHAGEIGAPRVSGCAPPMPPGHTFGRILPRSHETMQQVLAQAGNMPEDIGTSTTKSATLRRLKAADREVAPHDEKRSFGMPSIRYDKPAPKHKSISGNVNFGDEPGANQLLFPAPDTSSAAQKTLTTVDDAEVLANRCKFGLTRSEVEKAFNWAARKGAVTAASFKLAVDDLDL